MTNNIKAKASLIITVFTLLLFAGCDEYPNDFLAVNSGPDMSFTIKVNLHSSLSAKFSVKDVFMMDDPTSGPTPVPSATPKAKLGRSEGPFGKGGDTFKVTIPESYYTNNRRLTYNVELTRKNSGFERIPSIKKIPMALSILKSRYWTKVGDVPQPAGHYELNIPSNAVLILGYSPDSYHLDDVPEVPLIFFVDVREDPDVKDMGFRLKQIVATNAGGTILSDTIGVAFENLDWGMIMSESYTPRITFDLWLVYEQPDVGHACPCVQPGVNCTCPICFYAVMGKVDIAGYEINNPYGFRKPVTPASDVSGSSIRVTVNASDFALCSNYSNQLIP